MFPQPYTSQLKEQICDFNSGPAYVNYSLIKGHLMMVASLCGSLEIRSELTGRIL